MPGNRNAPHPTDVMVGGNLRALRKRVGLSQERMAKGLGVTFQQIQKYEGGSNRISASKLHQAAQLLGSNVEDLFAGLPRRHGGSAAASSLDPAVAHLVSGPEGFELAQAFHCVKDPGRRRLVLDLVVQLADLERETPTEACDTCARLQTAGQGVPYPGGEAQQGRTTMPKDTHTKAAEHHETAAKAHRTAAEHHGKNDHAAGHEHSTKAHGASEAAHKASTEAHGKSAAHAKK